MKLRNNPTHAEACVVWNAKPLERAKGNAKPKGIPEGWIRAKFKKVEVYEAVLHCYSANPI